MYGDFIGNTLFVSLLIAWQLGFLGDLFSGDDTEDDTADDTPQDDALYDPAAYAGEVQGTSGDDILDALGDPQGQAFFMQDGDDQLDATDFADYAEGGAGDDTLAMRLGDDIALGGDGNDTIDGGFGDDQLFGDAGNDTINGSKGDDEIFGGTGDDTLTGSTGNDQIDGGAGNDILSGGQIGAPGTADEGIDTLDGGSGDDTLQLSAGDTGTGGDGADTFELYDTADPANQATVTDFASAADQVVVYYDETFDPGTGAPLAPEVTVTPNADATGSTLALDGFDVAFIAGGQGLTADDIALVPAP